MEVAAESDPFTVPSPDGPEGGALALRVDMNASNGSTAGFGIDSVGGSVAEFGAVDSVCSELVPLELTVDGVFWSDLDFVDSVDLDFVDFVDF